MSTRRSPAPKPATKAASKRPTRAPAKAAAKPAKRAATAAATASKRPVKPPAKAASKTSTKKATTKKDSGPTTRTPAAPVMAGPSRAHRDLYAKHATALGPIWDPRTGLGVHIRVPASVSLAPARTRCRVCRSGFTGLVVLRMYCTYSCAGLPEPDLNPATAPRECKRAARTTEPGEWALKQKFDTAESAEAYLKPGMQVYRCANCFFLHLGNSSPAPQKGLPNAPSTGDLFNDCVQAVLAARGEDSQHAASLAAAKRDVRTVFETIRANQQR